MGRNQTKPESGSDSGGESVGRVCVGRITGVHGTGGAVRIESFTENPADIAAYGTVTGERGRVFRLRVERVVKGGVVARLDGINDRTTAQDFKNTALFVARDALPPPESDEWYHADLVGCRADTPIGRLGEVVAVHDFGAGPLLEIKPDTTDSPTDTFFVPFTRAAVPVVEIAARRVVIDPPDGLMESSRS